MCAVGSRGPGVRPLPGPARHYLQAVAQAPLGGARALDAADDERIAAREAVLAFVGHLVGALLRTIAYVTQVHAALRRPVKLTVMGHRPRSRAILVALALATTVGPAAAEDDPPEPDASLLAPDDAPVPDDAPPDDDAAPDDAPAPALDPRGRRRWPRSWSRVVMSFRTKGNYYTKRKKPDKATERYERALEAYAKAFELGGDPAVQIKMANVEEKLGRWVDAARHYAGFLAAVADPDPADKAEAEGRLEVVKEHLGVLTLTIAPEGAAVSIDGTALGTAPLTAPIYLAPGPHALEITADGYQPSTPQLEVDAGSEAERTFELEPVPAVIVDTPPPPPPRVVEPVALPPGPSKLPLIGGGVAVGLAGGAVATGLMALARHDVFVDASASPGRRELALDVSARTWR